MSTALLEIHEVSKRFGGVHALVDVSVTIEPGTIHAVIGENGAGKSTLGRIVSGIVKPDAGTVAIDGAAVRFASPRDALRAGVATVSQDVALVPARSVLENVLLGVEPARVGVPRPDELRSRFELVRRAVGFELDADALVRSLRPSEQRKTEILRAVARGARLIVMDEPTASLGLDERRQLAEAIRRLADAGTAILLVTHDLREVLDLAETVTVMRNGRIVHTAPTATETAGTLITAMLGRTLPAVFPAKQLRAAPRSTLLEVVGLTRRGVFEDISFEVGRGEIVALAGVVGSGHSEVLRAIFGADRLDAGEILLEGTTLRVRRPGDAARRGIALLPERRREQGLVMTRPVRENVTLAALRSVSTGGVVQRRSERARVTELAELVGIRTQSFDAPVSTLSGGNQQKTVFAKWLARRPKVLLADDPTRGVDIGARLQIYELIVELAREGIAVVFVPSDTEEAIGLAHRLIVFRDGRIVDELDGATATAEAVLAGTFGAEGGKLTS